MKVAGNDNTTTMTKHSDSKPHLQHTFTFYFDCSILFRIYIHTPWSNSSSSSNGVLFTRIQNLQRKLNLCGCALRDKGIRIIVDGLVGNTVMEVLSITFNGITKVGLSDITRLIGSTQIKTIDMRGQRDLFNDENATQHFLSTLQDKKSCIEEIPWISDDCFPESSRAATIASMKNSLTRNRSLNHLNLLLAPQPPPQQLHQQQRNATAMVLKILHKAVTKFAMVPNHAGASAIFKLFQARPQLLDKRFKRPTPHAPVVSHGQKRRRL